MNENLVANGSNLDRGDMGSVEVSAYNDLDLEDSINTARGVAMPDYIAFLRL